MSMLPITGSERRFSICLSSCVLALGVYISLVGVGSLRILVSSWCLFQTLLGESWVSMLAIKGLERRFQFFWYSCVFASSVYFSPVGGGQSVDFGVLQVSSSNAASGKVGVHACD